MGKIASQFYGARLGRYQVLMHGAIRPDSYSELIVRVLVFQRGVCDRYPNADEVFLAVDIFDYHAAELRKARMEKLLDGGLEEYWAVDLLDGSLTAYRASAGGLARATYGFHSHVSPASFPDIDVDLTELAESIYSPSAGTRM